MANLPVANFRSQPREMLLLKPLNTYISVFLFEYWFSFPPRKVLTSLSVSDMDISVLAAMIRGNSHKLPWIENGEGFAVHSSDLTEWCKRPVTCQQLIEDIKYTWKKIWYFFHLFCYDISWSWKSNGEMLNKLEKYITVQRNLKLSNVWSRVWLNSSVSPGSKTP